MDIITERDCEILKALMKCPTMTMENIKKYFPSTTQVNENKNHGAYRRIKKLIERGYIKRSGKYIHITNKGIEKITGTNEVAVKASKLVRNKVNNHQIKLGELYVQLCGTGWNFLNSRETKRLYRLNRNERIDGTLNYSNKNFALYLLSEVPSQRSFQKIRSEINTHTYKELNNTIVFCTSKESMKLFSIFEDEPQGAAQLMLLPYPFGIKIFKKMIKKEEVEALYKSYLGPYKEKPANRPFAEKIIQRNGMEYYITELITNDLVKKYHLRQYSSDVAQKEDRGVMLFALESQQAKFSKDFEAYPHINIVTIPETWCSE